MTYDIVPNQWTEVQRTDILIVEGVNVLQTGRLGKAALSRRVMDAMARVPRHAFVRQDLQHLARLLEGVRGYHPEQAAPIRLR